MLEELHLCDKHSFKHVRVPCRLRQGKVKLPEMRVGGGARARSLCLEPCADPHCSCTFFGIQHGEKADCLRLRAPEVRLALRLLVSEPHLGRNTKANEEPIHKTISKHKFTSFCIKILLYICVFSVASFVEDS